MFTRVRSIYSAIGVMLFLIALYLVLANGPETARVIRSVGNFSVDLARTLQGR